MVTAPFDPQEASDILFFESEAPEGFLHQLKAARRFDVEHWQRLWQAVASLIEHQNGQLDQWEAFDLTRIVLAVQKRGAELAERHESTLDEFERLILEANTFLRGILIE
ncbi:MAG: hypothetical protein Kow0077_07590 [Anaerolineae bacterium]